MKPSAISVQRVYEGTGPDTHYRALVDRMWPVSYTHLTLPTNREV